MDWRGDDLAARFVRCCRMSFGSDLLGRRAKFALQILPGAVLSSPLVLLQSRLSLSPLSPAKARDTH